jgi:hypothetical protein
MPCQESIEPSGHRAWRKCFEHGIPFDTSFVAECGEKADENVPLHRMRWP